MFWGSSHTFAFGCIGISCVQLSSMSGRLRSTEGLLYLLCYGAYCLLPHIASHNPHAKPYIIWPLKSSFHHIAGECQLIGAQHPQTIATLCSDHLGSGKWPFFAAHDQHQLAKKPYVLHIVFRWPHETPEIWHCLGCDIAMEEILLGGWAHRTDLSVVIRSPPLRSAI